MKTEELYLDKFANQVKQWSAEFDLLRKKAKGGSVDAKEELLRWIEAHRRKEASLRHRIAKIETSGRKSINEVRVGFKQAWNDLAAAFEKAAASLQNATAASVPVRTKRTTTTTRRTTRKTT